MPTFLISRFLSKVGQSGIASLALLLLLIVGIGVGTYLSTQRTDFYPSAKTKTASTTTGSTEVKRDPLLGIRVGDAANMDKAFALGVSKIRVSVESVDAFYNETELQKNNSSIFGKIFNYSKNNNFQLVIVVKPASIVDTADLENRLGLMKQSLGANTNVVFELGNEPNGKTPDGGNFWEGDYNSFATFIKESTIIIRKLWPSNPIIIGALDIQGKVNGSSEEAAKADVIAFLDALSTQVTLNNYDYAIHSYHNADWFNRVYAIQKSAMADKGVYGKLWLTEVGTNSESGAQPAQQLVEIIKAAESKNDIKAVIIHALDSTDNFSLLTNGAPNDKYNAVQAFVGNNPSSVTVPQTPSGPGGAPIVSAGDKSCGNDPVAPPSSNLVWHAFCSDKDYAPGHFTCNSNSDCPQNTIETASGVNSATSSQCVQFKEGARCIQLRTKATYKTDDPAFETPNDIWAKDPANIPFGRVGLAPNEGTGKGPRADFTLFISSWQKTIARIKEDQRVKELLAAEQVQKQQDLLAEAEKAAQEAKEANEAWLKDKANPELAKKASDAAKKAADAVAAAEAIRKLAKLEQLLKGDTQEMCVKADLGIRPWLNARRIKARGEDTREDGSPGEKVNRYSRLYVCSGQNGQLKWRVATEGNDNTDDADNQNSLERILGLHGTEQSPVSPVTDGPYPTPFTGIEGARAILYGQDMDSVRKSLEKYINAAKAGKAVIEEAPTQVAL